MRKLNENLNKATKAKNDEFYTQLHDIEKEIFNYKDYFKDKVVYCNCDDPEWSNFYKYFDMNFNFLGLKKVITTHYKQGEQSYKLEINEQGKTIKTNLNSDGDFRKEECIEILKGVDIVITNPPFSLFREYIKQLVSFNKKFIVVGNYNSITYKEIFPLIKENKLWVGVSPRSMKFILPNGDLKDVNACWFTNLEHEKRNEKIILFEKFKGNENKYPKYENYNAIEVSKVNEIPSDYYGCMGVPITFMDKYNPNQFELIGMAEDNGKGFSGGIWDGKNPHCVIDGKNKFKRIFIKRRSKK